MSIRAYSELQYIESKGHDTNLTLKEAISILESKNIQIGVNPFVLSTLEELAKEYEKNKLYNQSLYFHNLLYDLNHDEKTLNKIKEIQNILTN